LLKELSKSLKERTIKLSSQLLKDKLGNQRSLSIGLSISKIKKMIYALKKLMN
jgi:hypothetical protein